MTWALTIGMFDGVHRGHQRLLERLQDTERPTVAITFANHPAEILGRLPPPLLTPLPLKTALLRFYGIGKIIALPFSQELSEQTYEEFLAPYPIGYLLVGQGDAFGKNRAGNFLELMRLGIKRGFGVWNVSKLIIDEEPVSSTRIRALIQEGNIREAETLLGRPHLLHCDSAGEVQGLLPPDGAYPVWDQSLQERELLVEQGKAKLSLDNPSWISFSPNLNPNLLQELCRIQTSPAES